MAAVPMRRRALTLGMALLALILSACGWHLRGSSSVDLAIKELVVNDQANDGLLHQMLLQKLSQAGVAVAQSGATGVPILTLHKATQSRRPLTFVSGKVDEYELLYRLEFDVMGENEQLLLPRQSVEAIRTYTFDEQQVLAKDREQKRLYQEMRQDLISSLLYRLQSIHVEAK